MDSLAPERLSKIDSFTEGAKLLRARSDRLMAQLAEHIDQIDGLMKKLVNSSEELKAQVKALCQLKGSNI